ncbi:MAG: hypothetical protein M3162_05430 [Thermoproteota archaeon]|nr:hypothetical protein [Thermoproteota archaeon]
MSKKEAIKIFFIALIVGNIMGLIVIQIFQEITIESLILLEITLVAIIVLLFKASKLWKKRLDRINKNKKVSNE